MANRYISNIQTPGGTKYRIAIWDDDYEDSPIDFHTDPDGFTLKYEGFTDEPWKPFIASSLEFGFIIKNSDDEDFVVELATSNPQRFKVVVTYSSEAGDGTNALYWMGYIQSEGITLIDEGYPTHVRLTCTDIAFFKDIDYKDGDSPIVGKQNVANMLLSILEVAGYLDWAKDGIHGFEDILQTEMNWRGTEMPTDPGVYPVEYTVIDQWTFWNYNGQNEIVYRNCQEVMEHLCAIFGCRFFQSAGLFRFQQIDGLVESDVNFEIFDVYRDVTSAGTINHTVEVDRVDTFQNGGTFVFTPGLKQVQREYQYRRNYLEGLTASNESPAFRLIGDIPVSAFDPPQGYRYTLKFTINYKIVDFPKRLDLPSTPGIYEWATWTDDAVHFVPMWRMQMYANREDTEELVWWSQVDSKLNEAPYTGEGFEDKSLGHYKNNIGTKRNWSGEWARAAWRGEDTFHPEMGFFEIIDGDDYPVYPQEVVNNHPVPYSPIDRAVNVELVIPPFPSLLVQRGMKDLTFELDIHKLYNRHFKEWYQTDDPDSLNDYITWTVDGFELILHPEKVEDNPDTGMIYRAINTGDFRRKVELPTCLLTGYDKRTWHSIEVNDGTKFVDNAEWYRRDEDEDTIELNYLNLREYAAFNKGGRRMWQGQIIPLSETLPLFHTPILKNGVKYLMVQGSYSAHLGEWNGTHLFELSRDTTGITYEKIKTGEGKNTLPGGNVSGNNGSGDGGGSGSTAPQYESESGVTGAEYEVQNIDLSVLETADSDDINVSLWVFQDATKLTYGTGYTIDFDDNKIIPTHEFSDSFIELYFFG